MDQCTDRWAEPMYPNILSNCEIIAQPLPIASLRPQVTGYGRLYGNNRNTKGIATLNISALVMVTAYLLLVAAGTIGVLLVLLWLFGEMPGTTENIGREKLEDSRIATRLGSETAHSLSLESERWEDDAA